jgi:hypothetical protein
MIYGTRLGVIGLLAVTTALSPVLAEGTKPMAALTPALVETNKPTGYYVQAVDFSGSMTFQHLIDELTKVKIGLDSKIARGCLADSGFTRYSMFGWSSGSAKGLLDMGIDGMPIRAESLDSDIHAIQGRINDSLSILDRTKTNPLNGGTSVDLALLKSEMMLKDQMKADGTNLQTAVGWVNIITDGGVYDLKEAQETSSRMAGEGYSISAAVTLPHNVLSIQNGVQTGVWAFTQPSTFENAAELAERMVCRPIG